MKYQGLLSVLISLLGSSLGFVINGSGRENVNLHRVDNAILFAAAEAETNDTGGVVLVSLAGLGNDHELVGENMAKSVAAWLDAEWMPQEVHVKMGTSVKNTYISCRNKGMDDVAEIMTQVTDDLYERWSEYNADAFVNAWDIGNYVADYLIAKSGSETCGCSTTIVE
ncbi:hypothetical protein ACHAWU_009333 [Discostella pseudostelligera]|uniref:Uncharacterized protein n=1 Tax=Discostella pseudostelligera TaxID=259834 RepID=A0ABD3N2X8_9STRA